MKLTAAEASHLNELTKPVLGFPQSMMPMFPQIHNGGTSVNGVMGASNPFMLNKGEKPY